MARWVEAVRRGWAIVLSVLPLVAVLALVDTAGRGLPASPGKASLGLEALETAVALAGGAATPDTGSVPGGGDADGAVAAGTAAPAPRGPEAMRGAAQGFRSSQGWRAATARGPPARGT